MPSLQRETIRTRVSREAVASSLSGIGLRLRRGECDRLGLTEAFLSNFIQHLFREIHESFLLKSKGRSDSLGQAWKPLSPSTIRAKQRLSLPRSPGVFTSEDKSQWRALYTRALAGRAASPANKASARAFAWRALAIPLASHTPINVRTGRLERSLRPGPISGGRYTPPREQLVSRSGGVLKLGVSVPYSSHIQAARPLIPDASLLSPWLSASVRAGVSAILRQLRRAV